MTGFAAATWLRGIRVIQVPTTLLAMVDAAIGGKTGVNHPGGKNLIGAFHQPSLVMIDPNTLNTLPVREFRAGMAEVIKYGILGDAELFQSLEEGACTRLSPLDLAVIDSKLFSSDRQQPRLGWWQRMNGKVDCEPSSTTATPLAMWWKPFVDTAPGCTERRWRSGWRSVSWP